MNSAIAKMLLDIGAVSLRIDPPFTWTSGRKSPIYCDNRLIMSFPEHRKRVTEGFVSLLEERNWKPEVIAGTATAGIPHAAWLSHRLDLPMVYVRSAAKAHGKQNQIEGASVEGKTVVLIEDLISTGKSSIAAAQGLLASGADLLGVAGIFTYGLAVAKEQFDGAGISCGTLTSFELFMKQAESQGQLSPGDLLVLADWQKDPAAWSDARM